MLRRWRSGRLSSSCLLEISSVKFGVIDCGINEGTIGGRQFKRFGKGGRFWGFPSDCEVIRDKIQLDLYNKQLIRLSLSHFPSESASTYHNGP